MIANFVEFLFGALGEIMPAAFIREKHTPQPGDYFQARHRVDVRACIRGTARAAFMCPVWSGMTIRIDEEHLTRRGDILATAHSDGHAALLPDEYRAQATVHGYLLMIPLRVLNTSFKHIAPAPSR